MAGNAASYKVTCIRMALRYDSEIKSSAEIPSKGPLPLRVTIFLHSSS
jgi:hypothetical protein